MSELVGRCASETEKLADLPDADQPVGHPQVPRVGGSCLSVVALGLIKETALYA